VLILAADTSLAMLSVALLRDDTTIGAIALEGKGSRNEKLLPAIDWLLQECAVSKHDIDLFAVTRGPGSFTGVRIGLATLQGLALVLGRGICAMSTHEAVRELIGGDGRVAVRDDAGRGESYVTLFDGHAMQDEPRLASAGGVELLASAATVVDVADVLRTGNVAAGCARVASRVAARDELSRYADITPIYVRLAEAEVQLQQRRNA
jgi:tRNA threonylcarbamoyladenosine biosynthesis protein TsaB